LSEKTQNIRRGKEAEDFDLIHCFLLLNTEMIFEKCKQLLQLIELNVNKHQIRYQSNSKKILKQTNDI